MVKLHGIASNNNIIFSRKAYSQMSLEMNVFHLGN